MKSLSIAVTIILIASAFTYGVCVGRYKLPPYYGIKRLFRSFDNQPQANSSMYLDRTSFFERNGKKADVVMVGDSLTCRAEWQELLAGILVINRGIDGDTTSGILNRTGSIFSAKPKVIFLMAGVNDIDQRAPVKTIVGNIEKFITTAENNHTRIVVQSILLTSDSGSYAGFNEKVIKTNSAIAQLCRQHGVPYLDINTILGNYEKQRLNPKYTYDGIHLNGAGYELWGKEIAACLQANGFTRTAHATRRP